ncbi:MAG: ion transporter [Terriglobales bacterium]
MRNEERIGPFQLLLVALSIYVLAALAVEKLVSLSPEMQRVLQWTDTAICVVFICDFFVRLFRASDKREFLRWGWIDLASSIPMLDAFRWGRLVRVARVIRVLRSIRSARVLVRFVFQTRAKGALASAVFAATVLATFSSITILHVENDPQSNIKTAEDAIWWSITTLTTVGNSDRFPVTLEGRAIAILLMFTGTALFGVFTAYVASWFVGEQEERTELAGIRQEISALRQELAVARSQNGAQGVSTATGSPEDEAVQLLCPPATDTALRER